MAVSTGYDTYLSSHYDGMDPKQLILMLYKGALKHIRLAKQGILEKNTQKRGENLSKTIAIVSELNASLDPSYKDDAIEFLRGLYAAILSELPKVSINNDIGILDRSASYISELKEIWETSVMAAPGRDPLAGQQKVDGKVETQPVQTAHEEKTPGYQTYDAAMNLGGKSFTV